MKRSARTRGAALPIHVKHHAKPSDVAAGLPPALNSGRRQRPCTIWRPAAKPDRTHAASLPTHPPTVSGHWRVVTVRSQTGAAVGGPVRGDEATSLIPRRQPHVARQVSGPWPAVCAPLCPPAFRGPRAGPFIGAFKLEGPLPLMAGAVASCFKLERATVTRFGPASSPGSACKTCRPCSGFGLCAPCTVSCLSVSSKSFSGMRS
jgi:hypothetical protein